VHVQFTQLVVPPGANSTKLSVAQVAPILLLNINMDITSPRLSFPVDVKIPILIHPVYILKSTKPMSINKIGCTSLC
jgi:hypothetical protein